METPEFFDEDRIAMQVEGVLEDAIKLWEAFSDAVTQCAAAIGEALAPIYEVLRKWGDSLGPLLDLVNERPEIFWIHVPYRWTPELPGPPPPFLPSVN